MRDETGWVVFFGSLIFILGFFLGGIVDNGVGWIDWINGMGEREVVVVVPAPSPTPGPLTFTVAMNGVWEYECLSMEFIGPTDPDFQP